MISIIRGTRPYKLECSVGRLANTELDAIQLLQLLYSAVPSSTFRAVRQMCAIYDEPHVHPFTPEDCLTVYRSRPKFATLADGTRFQRLDDCAKIPLVKTRGFNNEQIALDGFNVVVDIDPDAVCLILPA